MSSGKVALIILDGYGIGEPNAGNAIYTAKTPVMDGLLQRWPHTKLSASGLDVGLPDGQMGNSEVGHTNIGSGRVVFQDLPRITNAISDGSFFENPVYGAALDNAANGKALHILGLLSDGGVHSHIRHIFAMVKMAHDRGIERVYLHCFLDGRDVAPTSGAGYVRQLHDYCAELGTGKIATLQGRFYGMDRDKRWDRIQKAYEAISCGVGDKADCPICAMKNSYKNEKTDEFVVPCVIQEDGKPVATVEAGDSMIFFNFRPDRTREITRAFIDANFSDFERLGGYKPVTFVGMTRYDDTFTNIETAFKPVTLTNTMGEYLAANGKTQLRIAETEKYAHVTFFFNGGVEAPNPGEDRELIPSPKVTTYDLKPEMSAYEVTDKAVELIGSGKYDVMILNFANCDMVGHTGVLEAAEKAVKTVDACVDRVVKAVLATGGQVLITADHGNADMMIDPTTGEPFTAHTTNKVPFILVDPSRKDAKLREGGRLADLAPTMLELMGLPKPAEMTGESLIAK